MAVGISKRRAYQMPRFIQRGQKQMNFVDQNSVEGVSLEARWVEMETMSQVPWKEIEFDLCVVTGR